MARQAIPSRTSFTLMFPPSHDVCPFHPSSFMQPKSSPRASRILLVADPHVIPDTHPRAHTLVQRFRDIHLRKSWAAIRRLRPHTILFLGDMLASGGAIKDDDE